MSLLSPWTWLLYAGLIGSVALGYFSWRSHERGIGEQTITVKWDAAKKLQQAAADKATAENVAKENAWIKKVQEAKDEDAKRIKKLAADAAAAKRESDSLRGDLATARGQMSNSTCDSVRSYAATLATVFGECSRAIEELASATDQFASDLQLMMSSWPTK